MEVQLFDMDVTRWPILVINFIPAFISIGIFLYSFFLFEKNSISSNFSVFVMLIGLWQICDGSIRLSHTLETASEWNRIANVFLLFLVPVGLRFVIYFIGAVNKAHDRLMSVLLFLPSMILLFLVVGKQDKYTLVSSDSAYWVVNPEPTLITVMFFIWISAGTLSMLFLLWLHYFKTGKTKDTRMQSLLLACGLSFPVTGGIVFETLYPMLFGINDIPLTCPLMTIFSVTSFLAISRYELLTYSSKHHWRDIVESMSEGLMIVDNEDRIQYTNEALRRVIGYSSEELLGQIAHEMLVDDLCKDKINKALSERKGKKSGQYQAVLIAKNGEKIHMLISGSPYLDRKNKVIGSIGMLTNITSLKNAELALEHSERRLNQAQELSMVGSWEVDIKNGKCSWSEAACSIYGISSSERHKQTLESWLSLIHPEDLEQVLAKVKSCHEKLEDASFKHRIKRHDGSIRHIHSSSKFEFDRSGLPIYLFGVCQDITAQVEADEALRLSEENMRTFINESIMSIYFVDPPSKKILYANPAMCEMVGYTADELRNMTPYEFVNHPMEDIEERLREVMRHRRVNNGERQWKSKNGAIIHVLVNSFYHQKDGKDIIYIAAQDITEKKKVEEKLKHSNEELKTFIYKASHDIRGPLATVLGLLNVGMAEVKSVKAQQYFSMIDSVTQKLDYTLGELVKAMRMKDVEILSDEVNFVNLIDDIQQRYSQFPGYNTLAIATSINYQKPVLSNRAILDTIFQNLFENAIKYQRTGTQSSFLKIEVSSLQTQLVIVFEDNGIGIRKDMLPQIFEMYFKANPGSKGSGLGLYLVKKGVDKLNGNVTVESKLGAGTKFTIILPLL